MKHHKKALLTILLFTGLNIFAQDPSIVYPYEFKATSNPFVTHMRTADPSCKVWADGKLWMYASHDPDNAGSNYDGMDGYHVFSTTDLETWTDYGEVLHSRDVEWNGTGSMWAPDCAYKNGKYYFYFPSKLNGENFRTGVAISDKPQGPFIPEKDFLQGTTGIDPMCFIDDDGQAYLYFGYTGSPFVAKLKDNMIELAENMRRIDIGCDPNYYVEGSFMHKYNGKYYLSWSNYKGVKLEGDSRSYGALYAVGDSPYGPFEFKGGIKENPNGAQDHHSIVEYHGQWYMFYHTGSYNGGNSWKRNTCVAYLYHNADGTIKFIEKDSKTMVAKDLVWSSPATKIPGSINAIETFKQQGTTVSGNSITSLNNDDFAEYVIDVLGPDSYTIEVEALNISNAGNIELYLNGKLTSTIPFTTESQKISATVQLEKGRFLLKAVFKSNQSDNMLDISKFNITSGFNYYKITPIVSTGGKIMPEGEIFYKQGSNASYNFASESGYKISDVLVNGVSKGALSTYTFDDIDSDQQIEVNFETCNATATLFCQLDDEIKTETTDLKAEWGQTIRFLPESTEDGTWNWTGPNNLNSDQKDQTFIADIKNQGKYKLYFKSISGCVSQIEVNVTITLTAYQAENWVTESGTKKENCSDVFGGQNLNYIENNDWAQYNIDIAKTDDYDLVFRVASPSGGGSIQFWVDGNLEQTILVTGTAGWQVWKTTDPVKVSLTQGAHSVKLVFTGSGFLFNINWFKITKHKIIDAIDQHTINEITIFPNPVSSQFRIQKTNPNALVVLFNNLGQTVLRTSEQVISVENLYPGVYIVRCENKNAKVLVIR